MQQLLRVTNAVLLMLALSFGSSAAIAESKIGVVDTGRTVWETEDGLRAKATLRKVFESRQRDLDKKQEELRKQRAEIEKQRTTLDKAAVGKRISEWEREVVQLQTVIVEYQKEFDRKQNELTQPIIQKTMGIIRRLATQEAYDVVVDKQFVPYVRSDLDLTDRVIVEYNRAATQEPAPRTGPPKGGKVSPGAPAPTPAPLPAKSPSKKL